MSVCCGYFRLFRTLSLLSQRAPSMPFCARSRGLHHRPDAPWHKLFMAQNLALRPFARGHAPDCVENFAAHVLNRLLPVNNYTSVDVNVVLHQASDARVGGEF